MLLRHVKVQSPDFKQNMFFGIFKGSVRVAERRSSIGYVASRSSCLAELKNEELEII